jgi:hypothetical protein
VLSHERLESPPQTGRRETSDERRATRLGDSIGCCREKMMERRMGCSLKLLPRTPRATRTEADDYLIGVSKPVWRSRDNSLSSYLPVPAHRPSRSSSHHHAATTIHTFTVSSSFLSLHRTPPPLSSSSNALTMRTTSLLLAASIPAALALPSFRFSADPTELAAQAFSSAQEWLGNAVQGAMRR